MIAIATIGNAQDLSQAKKAIDAEQYEKAKTMLKSIVNSNGKDATPAFLLGNIYLKQSEQDSAKIFFNKALASADNSRLGNIGLGQIDLDNANATAAKSKFDQVASSLKKKDFEEYIYIAQAYINSEKPNYDAAISLLEKAKAANPKSAEVLLALGDAYYGKKDQNNAYSAYRSAYTMDNSLIRAKMQQGVLLKGAKSYNEAIKAYDEVIKLDSNYGPVYRELAETYYLWAYNNPRDYKVNIAKSLTYYEKYMSLTDYSLSSRMRHADFLILAQDYKALEAEANEMKKLDKVNPRILRYLGYSAYENGNNDNAISSLTEYINKGSNKIIGGDYYYLGLAQIKKSVNEETKAIEQSLFDSGVANLKKGVEMSNGLANALNEKGKEYFSKRLYNVAQTIFEVAISNPDSKNLLEDTIYYALSVITNNRGKEGKDLDTVSLENADKALEVVVQRSPDYAETYLYKARINSTLEKNDVMTANYQKYVDINLAKGVDEVEKNKAKMTEAYNNMGAYYSVTDKAKAKEMFNKTLALDPTNEFATQNMKN
jgi:cytochrome c-type biogenesis protein CcmH/NrfG